MLEKKKKTDGSKQYSDVVIDSNEWVQIFKTNTKINTYLLKGVQNFLKLMGAIGKLIGAIVPTTCTPLTSAMH